MWNVMANAQEKYSLSERLIRAISNWSLPEFDDDVEDLLDQGADVNGQHGTLLPLHCACMVDDEECVQLLLDRGAQMNCLDGYSRAALHYAAERREGRCLALLLAHFSSQRRRVSAAADVNVRDAGSATPLHWAAYKHNVPCVRALLERRADVDATDINDDTPLSWAAVGSVPSGGGGGGGGGEGVGRRQRQGRNGGGNQGRGRVGQGGGEDQAQDQASQDPGAETVRLLLSYNARTDTRNAHGCSALDRTLDMQARMGRVADVNSGKQGGGGETEDKAEDKDKAEGEGRTECACRTSEAETETGDEGRIEAKCDCRTDVERIQTLAAASLLLSRATAPFDLFCCTHKTLHRRCPELKQELWPSMFSLRHITRCAIRKHLGSCYLPDVIPQLPIPRLMHSYLLLET